MAQAIGWRVTGQSHTQAYTGNGSFEPVIEVSYVTDRGTKGMFQFPEARYSADTVADTINAFVEREAAVHALGNGQ